MPNIVILGGNFAGVSTAKYLLKKVLPAVDSSETQHKVTLVSPSAWTFFKVAAPRILAAEEIPNEKAFAPIQDSFSEYSLDQFTFIQGEAVGLDEETKTVSVKGADATSSLVKYDYLVIATGTTSASALWSLQGDHKVTLDALQHLQERLPASKTVLVAGGGAVGVEVAGEIASRYKDKQVTLLSGGACLLPKLQNTKVAPRAEHQLKALGVQTLHGVRITASKAANSATSLVLSDGSTKTVDLYIDATGGTPNTSFLPSPWLDASKRVATDDSTMRTTKAPDGVYAIGDVASYSNGGIPDATWAIPALGYSIWYDICNAADNDGSMKQRSPALKEATYKRIKKDMNIVPIGPSGGVGSVFGWAVPSFFVWLLKSRTFMIEKAPQVALGY